VALITVTSPDKHDLWVISHPNSHTSFTNPTNMVSTPNESLNTMKDIKANKLGNFIINSIINPKLLIKLPMLKVLFLSLIKQAIRLF